MQLLLPDLHERVKFLAVEDVDRAASTSLINPIVTSFACLAIVVVLLVNYCDNDVSCRRDRSTIELGIIIAWLNSIELLDCVFSPHLY